MALTATTLGAPCALGATSITVASASGFAVGNVLLVDREVMRQTAAASGLVIAVRRGLDGTIQAAHTTRAAVVTGLATDFPGPAPGQNTTYGPNAPDGMMEGWNYYTYGVAGAITVAPGVHVINGTAAIAMTLAAPTTAQEGALLIVESKNLHANTCTATPAYLGAAGTGIATFAATGGNLQLKAVNGSWTVIGVSGVTFT